MPIAAAVVLISVDRIPRQRAESPAAGPGRRREGNPMPTEQPHAICGAKTRAGHPCQQRPMPNGRCRMHGGATPRGVASPHFRHGRYSKALPVRLAAVYAQARTDDDLLAVRDEAALLQVRIGELLTRLAADDVQDDARIWREVRTTIDALRKASASERKRLVDMRAMVTADEAMAFAAAVMAVVRACITDQATLAKFQTGMQRIFEELHGRVL